MALTYKEVETDGREHIIKEYQVEIDLDNKDEMDIDEDYIQYYFEQLHPNKEVCVIFLHNSPCNFQDEEGNPNEEWYEVTIMEPETEDMDKLNTFINSI